MIMLQITSKIDQAWLGLMMEKIVQYYIIMACKENIVSVTNFQLFVVAWLYSG